MSTSLNAFAQVVIASPLSLPAMIRCFAAAARAHSLDHRQRPISVAGSEETVGERQPNAVLASAGGSDRPPRERLGFRGPPELEKDESALFRLERREQAVGRDLVDAGIACAASPRSAKSQAVSKGLRKDRSAVVAARFEPGQCAIQVAPLHLVGSQ